MSLATVTISLIIAFIATSNLRENMDIRCINHHTGAQFKYSLRPDEYRQNLDMPLNRGTQPLECSVFYARKSHIFEFMLYNRNSEFLCWTVNSIRTCANHSPVNNTVIVSIVESHALSFDLVVSNAHRTSSSSRVLPQMLATKKVNHENVRYVGISVVARPENIFYLPRVLDGWCSQMQSAASDYELVIFNFDPMGVQIDATSIPVACQDRIHIVSKDNGWMFQGETQQSKHRRDIIYMLQYMLKVYKSSMSYFMFGEDDFLICPSALDKIEESLRVVPDTFSLISYSYGSNGMLIHPKDIENLYTYLESTDNKDERLDSLIQKWALKKHPSAAEYLGTRQPYTYRESLFIHMGVASALPNEYNEAVFSCGRVIAASSRQPVIPFDLANCALSPVSPCDSMQ